MGSKGFDAQMNEAFRILKAQGLIKSSSFFSEEASKKMDQEHVLHVSYQRNNPANSAKSLEKQVLAAITRKNVKCVVFDISDYTQLTTAEVSALANSCSYANGTKLEFIASEKVYESIMTSGKSKVFSKVSIHLGRQNYEKSLLGKVEYAL